MSIVAFITITMKTIILLIEKWNTTAVMYTEHYYTYNDQLKELAHDPIIDPDLTKNNVIDIKETMLYQKEIFKILEIP